MQQLLVGLVVAVTALLFVTVSSAPSGDSSEEDDVVYDQRQNGSENLRINLSDVMVVVAPAESLMPLAGDAFNTLSMGLVGAAVLNKVKTPTDCGENGRCKSASQRARLRLSNLLQPLVNRVHHHR